MKLPICCCSLFALWSSYLDVLCYATVEHNHFSKAEREDLMRYANATWNSMDAMTFPSTGFTADHFDERGCRSPSDYTCITNIGAYMWSAIVARDLGIITSIEAVRRINITINSLAGLERLNGNFYRGCNPVTGAVNGELYVSSVDSGWLAVSLILVKNAVPELKTQANDILKEMDFGLLRSSKDGLLCRKYLPNSDNCNCSTYKMLGETRIATYIGISQGQIPQTNYFKLWRTKLPNCNDTAMEMMPEGSYKEYMGINVFEGHFTYRNMNIVPNNGGSMFEALMVPLFVPEVAWGPKSWAINHPLYARAQVEHGLFEAKYGLWGFSRCRNPSGGYRNYGVDALGNIVNGYFSNNDNTGVDYGYPKCPGSPRKPQPDPPASAYTNGVVTPHAIFLALPFEPKRAMEAMKKLEDHYDMFGKYGFYDAVNVQTKEIAKVHLSLDQGMIMASLGNALRNNCLHKYLAAEPGWKKRVKPLLAMEEFTAGLVGPKRGN